MTEFRGRGGGEFGFERGVTLLVLDRAAIARLFLPGGDVYRWGRNLGIEVAEVAKGLLYPGHGYRTGALQRSVDSSVVPVGQGVQVNVRATASHAIYYIAGTRPHRIEPRTFIRPETGKRAWLRFEANGGVRFAKAVNHPGTRGHNFLDEAKEAVLLRRGIGV